MSTPSAHTDWFVHDRFGMFVHFGVYAGGARGEWLKSTERMTDEQYQYYYDTFEPDRFDAREIARLARRMGAKYVVLTTKHHDGFCLWDSKLTKYSAPTVCGRDLIREYVDAVRAEGLKVGFYHSLLDWRHPDYTIDPHHPLRDLPDVATLNAGRDMSRYRDYLHGQVRELLTEYGPVDLLFYDFTDPKASAGLAGKTGDDWDAERLLSLTRELQPEIVVNNRLGIPGDYETPEQVQPTKPVVRDGKPVIWEACQTTNGVWGYDRGNRNTKDPALLARMLIESVANGGNLILNIGPDGRGGIDPRDREVLETLGEWTGLHGPAIYGAGHSSWTPSAKCLYTQRGDRLYVHVLAWPLTHLELPGLAGQVAWARLLNDRSELSISKLEEQPSFAPDVDPNTLILHLPVVPPNVLVPVIELQLRARTERRHGYPAR